MDLNEEQAAVVFASRHEHWAVLAGAGSGKTVTIVERIVKLLVDGGPDTRILAVSFTRNAAHELRQRTEARLQLHNLTATDLHLGTFHSLAGLLFPACVHPVANVDECLVYFERAVAQGQVKPFDFLIVDEFQDVNEQQVELVFALARQGTRCLVVGDDDQQIYGFRGSSIPLMTRVIEELPCKVLYLSTNYRSTPEIVRFANVCASRNRKLGVDAAWMVQKPLMHSKARLPRLLGQRIPIVLDFDSFNDEMRYIEADIKRLVNSAQPGGVRIAYHDIAIIVRNNMLLGMAQGALRAAWIPCAIVSHMTGTVPDHVQLLTIHGSKGLEFLAVYLAGVGGRSLPDPRPDSNLRDDRRLLYVGVTRARRFLTLCHSIHTPSLLIAELEPLATSFITRWPMERAVAKTGKIIRHLQPKDCPPGTRAEDFLREQYLVARSTAKQDIDLSGFVNSLSGPDFVRIKETYLPANWQQAILDQMAAAATLPPWAEKDLRQEVLDFFHVAFVKFVAQRLQRKFRLPRVDHILEGKAARGVKKDFVEDRKKAYFTLQKPGDGTVRLFWKVAEFIAIHSGRRLVVHLPVSDHQLSDLNPHLQSIQETLVSKFEAMSAGCQMESPCAVRSPTMSFEFFARVGERACLLSPSSAQAHNESLMAEVVRAHALVALWRAVVPEAQLQTVAIFDLLVPQVFEIDLSAWDQHHALLDFLLSKRRPSNKRKRI